MQTETHKQERLRRAFLVLLAAICALMTLNPFYVSGIDIVFWGAVAVITISAPQLTAAFLRKLADIADHAAAKIPSDLYGSSSWATSLKDFGDAVLPFSFFKQNHGLYMGCLKRGIFGFGASPVFLKPGIPCMFVCGPSGSGKNVCHSDIILNTVSSSKFHLDFKEEDAPKYVKPMKRRGIRTRVLNFAGQFISYIGQDDSYNSMELVSSGYETPNGGILDVAPDSQEQMYIIVPDPKGGSQQPFFLIGSREVGEFAQQITILIKGKPSNYADVVALLNNRETLLHYALWASGRLEQEDGSLAKIPLRESPWAPLQDPNILSVTATTLPDSAVKSLTSSNKRIVEHLIASYKASLASSPACTAQHAPMIKKGPARSALLILKMRNSTRLFLLCRITRAKKPIVSVWNFCFLISKKS